MFLNGLADTLSHTAMTDLSASTRRDQIAPNIDDAV